MMIAITGEKINTSFGTMIILDSETHRITVGDTIVHNNERYIVKELIPPTRPEAKWAIRIS